MGDYNLAIETSKYAVEKFQDSNTLDIISLKIEQGYSFLFLGDLDETRIIIEDVEKIFTKISDIKNFEFQKKTINFRLLKAKTSLVQSQLDERACKDAFHHRSPTSRHFCSYLVDRRLDARAEFARAGKDFS